MNHKTYSFEGYPGDYAGFDYDGPKTRGGGYTPCYETHPTLKIGGGTLVGGSCITPVIKNADVYVGLDSGMRIMPYEPWIKPITQVLYLVSDMQAPKDVASFRKLVEYIKGQLGEGKTVHCGCIGGHGRTGTLFAALLKEVEGEVDAITKIRSIYCKRAVESDSQIAFLHDHFGISKVKGSKAHFAPVAINYTVNSGKVSGKGGSTKTIFDSASRVWKSVKSSGSAIGKLF